ncbi:hypothetical protein [Massilia sp. S19_KUP03_FR1]|uniref:hypothetical protein n=1 Tax=Massilia sp. S19_KUP03_FR1 TaxID=3025503 RepID=UPI002FCDACB1
MAQQHQSLRVLLDVTSTRLKSQLVDWSDTVPGRIAMPALVRFALHLIHAHAVTMMSSSPSGKTTEGIASS